MQKHEDELVVFEHTANRVSAKEEKGKKDSNRIYERR